MSKKVEPVKLRLLEERMELIWLLEWKGYGDTDIAEIMSIDRTWVWFVREPFLITKLSTTL